MCREELLSNTIKYYVLIGAVNPLRQSLWCGFSACKHEKYVGFWFYIIQRTDTLNIKLFLLFTLSLFQIQLPSPVVQCHRKLKAKVSDVDYCGWCWICEDCEDNNVTFHNSGSDYTGLGSVVSQNKAAHQSVVWSARNKQYLLMNLNYTAG